LNQKVIDAITRERAHQVKKWGDHPRSVPGWLLIIEEELAEAKEAWARTEDDKEALRELLQVATAAVQCLAEHGVVEREWRVS
jgi:hypothetical protein